MYHSFFFVWYWGLNSGPTPWTTPPTLLCEGSHGTICPGWLGTAIPRNYLPRLASNRNPLISASWVARITGVSHQCPAHVSRLNIWTNAQPCSWKKGQIKLLWDISVVRLSKFNKHDNMLCGLVPWVTRRGRVSCFHHLHHLTIPNKIIYIFYISGLHLHSCN
jgi:hypothetical protein